MATENSTDKLCRLYDVKLKAIDDKWEVKFTALEKAILKSDEVLQIRLEEMNNFRKQITEERVSYITRRETVLLNFIISIAIVFIGAALTYLITK